MPPKKPITKEPEGAPVPTLIQLTCPFGFYDDGGNLRMWQAGQEVSDPDEIQMLLKKGAEHIDIQPE